MDKETRAMQSGEYIQDVTMHKQYAIVPEDYGIEEAEYVRILGKFPAMSNRYADRVMFEGLLIEEVPAPTVLNFRSVVRIIIKIRELRIEEAELLKELKTAYNIKQ